MKLSCRNVNHTNVSWSELRFAHDGTTINLDVSGDERMALAEEMLEVGVELLDNKDLLIDFLKSSKYWDDIVDSAMAEQ